jgi:putative zinc finger/helix-turn-helix YgiT family protein
MKCLHCESPMTPDLVTLKGEYRGRSVHVEMNGLRCTSCDFVTVRGRDLREFRRLVREEYRRAEQLLKSEELQLARTEMRATQESFADYLQVGVASIKRIEGGSVPERLMDEHIRMRLYPEIMEVLLQERLWQLKSLRGELAELPEVSAQCTRVWKGLSDCWNSQQLVTSNYNALFSHALTTCSERLHGLTTFLSEAKRDESEHRATNTPPGLAA